MRSLKLTLLLVVFQICFVCTVEGKQPCYSERETYCGKEPCKCSYSAKTKDTKTKDNVKKEEFCQCMKTCKVKEKVDCYNGICNDGSCICRKCWTGDNCNKYVNNYSPIFEQTSFHVKLPEEIPIGYHVTTVQATDQDLSETCGNDETACSCADIKYSIVSGNDQGYFTLDFFTGELTVKKLDKNFLKDDYSLEIMAEEQNTSKEDNKKEITETNPTSFTTVYITKQGDNLEQKRKRFRRSDGEMKPQLVGVISHTNSTTLVQGSIYEYMTDIKHGQASMAFAFGVKIKWALPRFVKYQAVTDYFPSTKQPIVTVTDTHVEFKFLEIAWGEDVRFTFQVKLDPEKTLHPGRHHVVTPVYITYHGQEYTENSQGEVTAKGPFYSVPVKIYTFDIITTGCAAPLGITDGKIKDFQITASTAHPNTPSANARYLLDGWCAMISDTNQFLQVDFLSQVRIGKVATWGRSRKGNWVIFYRITFSLDDIAWYDYMENGKTKIFKGNVDRYTDSTHWLTYPIQANHIRIIPTEWKNQICLRLEVYGCTDKGAEDNCLYPLGMESNWISNEAISDSLGDSGFSDPSNARLNRGVPDYPYGWMGSTDGTAYLQIDFGSMYRVTRVATQGAWVQSASEFPPYYTKAYELEFSNNSFVWHRYKENGQVKKIIGNTQDENAGVGVYAKMKTFVVARYIRIYPVEFNEQPVLRTEVYGCLYEPNFGKALPEFARRTFLLDPYKNKVYICLLKTKRLTEPHCFSTMDGSTWKEISNKVCSIFGLDKENGYLYAIGHLGHQYYVSKDAGDFWQVITNDEWTRSYPNLKLVRAIKIPDNLVSTQPTTNFTLAADSGDKWGVSGYGVHKLSDDNWLRVATWH